MDINITSDGKENYSVNFEYKIEIMKNGLLIGTLSGRNSGGAAPGPVPVNTAINTISDTTPTVGDVISSTTGSWDNSPTAYFYQWYRNEVLISGATSSTYTVVEADYNLPLTCTVVAANANGSSDPTTSNPTSNVLPLPYINTVIPSISGIATAGNTLTCSTGTFTGQGGVTYAYQWTKNGVDIPGATNNTYVVLVADELNYIGCYVIATNAGGASDPAEATEVYITNPSLSTLTTNHVYSGSDRALIYTPPGYSNNTDNYPVYFFYHGNGERGVVVDSSTLIGTGNGVQTVFSGSLSNTNRIISYSVYVTVNGVQVATGRFGVITGTGVTGTHTYDVTSSASYSITFTTPPPSGHQVRVYFTQSNLLSQGVFRYLNLGDLPGSSPFSNCIITCPQISRGSGGFTDTEWTDIIDYMISAGFRINTNRLSGTGLSLGGDMCDWLLTNANPGTSYSFCSYVDVAPGSTAWTPSYNNALWTNAANKGKLYIRGTSDPNAPTKIPTSMANGNATVRNFPVQACHYWGLGHNSGLWDTKCYNRKNRTDATGTADFDHIEWALRFSLDAEEQATLMTRWAEHTEESEDYRIAKIQVDALGAGAVKTALLADLAALKAIIGNPVIIDFGATSTSGNYNSVLSAASGTIKNNLVDDEGTNTGFQITIVNSPSATPGMTNMGDRLKGRQFGFESNTNVDGMNVDAAGTVGTITFSNLNNAKTYTLKIYVSNSNNAWTNRASLSCNFNGGAAETLYCDTQNFRYVKYTGLAPSGGEISGSIAQELTASTERIFYLQAMELIEEV